MFTCGTDISRERLLTPPVAGVYTAKAVAGKFHFTALENSLIAPIFP